MKLNYIAYYMEETETEDGNKEFVRLMEEVKQHGIEVLEFHMGENEIDKVFLREWYEHTLWISCREETIEWLNRKDIAVLSFQNAHFPEEDLFGALYYVENFEDVDVDFLEKVYQRKHHLPWSILETKRCYLREMTLEDVDRLFEIYEGDGMTDYMEGLLPYEEEKAYTKAYIQQMYSYYGFGFWMILEKKTGHIIGKAGVNLMEDEGELRLELGYLIAKEAQRKGYALECCRAILSYVKEELGYEEVWCYIQTGNEPSIKLAEKLGFVYVGEKIRNGRKHCIFKKNSL